MAIISAKKKKLILLSDIISDSPMIYGANSNNIDDKYIIKNISSNILNSSISFINTSINNALTKLNTNSNALVTGYSDNNTYGITISNGKLVSSKILDINIEHETNDKYIESYLVIQYVDTDSKKILSDKIRFTYNKEFDEIGNNNSGQVYIAPGNATGIDSNKYVTVNVKSLMGAVSSVEVTTNNIANNVFVLNLSTNVDDISSRLSEFTGLNNSSNTSIYETVVLGETLAPELPYDLPNNLKLEIELNAIGKITNCNVTVNYATIDNNTIKYGIVTNRFVESYTETYITPQFNRINTSINALTNNIKTINTSVNSLETYVTNIDSSISNINSSISNLDTSVSNINNNITLIDNRVKVIEDLDIKDGKDAGFGTVTATIGTNNPNDAPSVLVTTSGDNTAKNFAFTFNNIKGKDGTGSSSGDGGEKYYEATSDVLGLVKIGYNGGNNNTSETDIIKCPVKLQNGQMYIKLSKNELLNLLQLNSEPTVTYTPVFLTVS